MKPLDYQNWSPRGANGRAGAVFFHLIVLNAVLPVAWRMASGALAWSIPAFGGSLWQLVALLGVGLVLQAGNVLVWWRYRGAWLALGVGVLVGLNLVALLLLAQVSAFVALETLPLLIATIEIFWI